MGTGQLAGIGGDGQSHGEAAAGALAKRHSATACFHAGPQVGEAAPFL